MTHLAWSDSNTVDLGALYTEYEELEQSRNELLEACREARDALLAFSLVVISNDLDRDPRMAEAMKLLWGHGARLDTAIAAAEGDKP